MFKRLLQVQKFVVRPTEDRILLVTLIVVSVLATGGVSTGELRAAADQTALAASGRIRPGVCGKRKVA
jgi:hypothetical protein